ncbi:hypothetical protein O181_116558, partial [Austropuccinia psidii MF-1]|nr:hypothetical protein [Austropuccinia psidii MF-1]
TKVDTGCNKSTLISQGKVLAKIYDRLGNLWLLPNSLYVPDLTTNLLALSSIAKNETRIKKTISQFEIYLDNNTKPSFVCPISSGILETSINISDSRCLNTQIEEDGDLWHKRLGHMNKYNMKKLINTNEVSNVCNECIKGKITHLPFKHSFKTADYLLENIHLDLCGPFQTPSTAGAKYFLIIVDQMSGFMTTKLLKNKSDCFNHFLNFRLLAENTHATKILKITTDGGGEFVNKSFKNHGTELGSNHTISPSYTPQHNPFSEREAVSTATFLCNLIPKHENQVTPYEIWYKTKPPLHKLKTFGCQAWLKIPTKNISDKFGPKAWDGIFLGYENEASSYRILRLSDQKIIISKHVLFNEKKFPSLQFQKQITEEIFKTFPNSTSITTEEPTNESNSEENSSNAELVPEANEEEDVFVNALEQQPQRI